MNPCPNCKTNSGIQHDTLTMGTTTHVLICPRCGHRVHAPTIAEAVRKWNEEVKS